MAQKDIYSNDESSSKSHLILSHNKSLNNVNNDELFIKNAIDSNPEKGIELLYRRYFQPLCSHAIKYVGSKAIAEDLVSEVFYELYRTRAYIKIETSFRFYLFRAVRNRSFNFIKSEIQKVESLDEKHDEAFSEQDTPESISQYEEMYQDVQSAINNLPIERRRIYLLNRFEGKRYQEIADELQLSVKTVEVQLYRANKFIRTLLKDKWLLLLIILVHL
ncbi:DNA-directed RNA polymerase sigma-70 factor [Emticicia aquatilis]|uniref:DNA-directed RNA polymerase sigma-70 factor n=1 Tax=Emticicia aquatilis TaxID=1537369 RepID=A0A916YIH8_9BACT|nr:RNA polymerase sigma-70 factor [Emticicia aquatilis]GGD45742.1 DNA-directed RNA polymerase sigma-70 factor [Emticicia aquatilis]